MHLPHTTDVGDTPIRRRRKTTVAYARHLFQIVSIEQERLNFNSIPCARPAVTRRAGVLIWKRLLWDKGVVPRLLHQAEVDLIVGIPQLHHSTATVRKLKLSKVVLALTTRKKFDNELINME